MAFNRPLTKIAAINRLCESASTDEEIAGAVEKARNLLACYTDTAQKEIIIAFFDPRLRGQRLTNE